MRTLVCLFVTLSGLSAVFGGVSEEEIPIATIEREEPVDFAKEIFPILKANCIACHNASKAKGKLNLENPKAILKGGNEGPAVIAGNADDSLLLILAAQQDDPIMPPEGNKSNAVPLTSEELGLLKLWIDQGAKGEAAALVEAPEIWFPVGGGKQPVYNLAIDPGGVHAAVGRGNQIHYYDLARGKFDALLSDPALAEEKNFESAKAAHRDLVQSLAISPDGRVASGGFREVKIWNRPTQRLLHGIAPMPESVTALAASHDGSRAVAGDTSGNVRTWLLEKPEEKLESKVHDGAVTAVAFDKDGAKTVTASADATVRVRAASGEPNEVKLTTPAPVNAMALVKESSHIVTAHADHKLRLWPMPESEGTAMIREIAGHAKPVLCVSPIVSNTALVVSGAEDNTAKLWNIDEGKEVRSMDHGAPVKAVAVSTDGKRLVTVGGPSLKVWNLDDGAMLKEIKGEGRAITAQRKAELVLSAAKLAAGERKTRGDAAAKRFKEEGDKSKNAAAALAKAQADLERKRAALASLEAAHKAAAISGNDEEKKKAKEAFDKATGEAGGAEEAVARARQNAELGVRLTARAAEENAQAESNLAAADAAVKEAETTLESAKKATTDGEKAWNAVALSADGTTIIAGGENQEVARWSLNGKPLGSLAGNRAAITTLCVTKAGDILSAGANKTLLHWDGSPDWTVERTLGDGKDHKSFVDRVTAVAFDSTGKLLATGGGSPSRTGELKVWNVSDGSLVFANDESHSDTIVGIEFSPDGRHIACASTDRFVRIFDAAKGDVIAAFEGHTGHVLDVAWRADGMVLASAGADKVVKLWDFEGRKQIKTEGGFGKEVTSIDFMGAGAAFLASSGDQTVRINQEKLGGPAAYVHRSKTDLAGTLIVAGDQDSVVRVWNAGDKKLLWTLDPPES